jgi:hypothetical protein
MNKSNIFLSFVAVLTLFLAACGGGADVNADEVKSKAMGETPGNTAPSNPTVSLDNTQPVNASETPAQTPVVDPATATKIKFDKDVFDFGTVKAGEKVKHVYKFKNTGSKPLTITDAKGSCGCTVPEWPKAPIAPGATGEIKVEFDSANKSGQQEKTVTITANTDPATTVIRIKGEVIADPAADKKGEGIQVK